MVFVFDFVSCMSGHTVLAQRERERSRERESERERERGSTRNSWPLRATAREASRESEPGAHQSHKSLHWEPVLGVYLALAGRLRALSCARHMASMYYELSHEHYCC